MLDHTLAVTNLPASILLLTRALCRYQHTRDTVGSMARTAQDLILLDSVIRSSNYSTTGFGSVPNPVSCAVSIDPDFSLEGVRLGLPSTLAWTSPGISAEVNFTWLSAAKGQRP